MKTIATYDDIDFPTWALCYIFNDDSSGLEDNDIAIVDQWVDSFKLSDNQHIIFSPEFSDADYDSYFTCHPEFGLACDCVKMTVLILESEVN